MRLFVGNLSFDISSRDLMEIFEPFGKVTDSEVIRKREGGSRGFGFITMPDQEEALKATIKLNGQPFRGRALTVNEAHPRSVFGQVLSKARETADRTA